LYIYGWLLFTFKLNLIDSIYTKESSTHSTIKTTTTTTKSQRIYTYADLE